MEPTQQLIDALYADKLRTAGAMSDEQRLAAGVELFEFACQIVKEGIRQEFPEADEDRVNKLLAERLELARWLEEHPI